jgi:16S rRNA (guanine1207-N2)-methyltransferase
MKNLLELFPIAANKVVPPVAIILGSPWPVTQLVGALGGVETTCFQLDLYQAARLREKLAQEGLTAEVVTSADVWDLPAKFKTAIFLSTSQSDYELKLDMVEQGFQILEPGGRFITFSEYKRDTTFAKLHKKVFGKCSEAPRNKLGNVFWSEKTGEQPRRRHQIEFHARTRDGVSMQFLSWPGTFSYGRMDEGSRAMLEVAEVRPGDRVLDLGCGNGSVGCLIAPAAGPKGQIVFVDSNARAVKLAELNAKANGVANPEFLATDNLGDLKPASFDVVLANPPYYANSEVGRLFIDTAKEVLKPGGRLHFVTKMPVQTIPEIVETFGEVSTIENRGYTVVSGVA